MNEETMNEEIAEDELAKYFEREDCETDRARRITHQSFVADASLESIKNYFLDSGRINSVNSKKKLTEYIVASGRCDALNMLIDEKIITRLDEKINNKNWTLLHLAAYCRQTDIIRILLKKDKSLINLKDKDDATPLNIALEKNVQTYYFNAHDTQAYYPDEPTKETVQLLIDQGAEIKNTKRIEESLPSLIPQSPETLKYILSKINPSRELATHLWGIWVCKTVNVLGYLSDHRNHGTLDNNISHEHIEMQLKIADVLNTYQTKPRISRQQIHPICFSLSHDKMSLNEVMLQIQEQYSSSPLQEIIKTISKHPAVNYTTVNKPIHSFDNNSAHLFSTTPGQTDSSGKRDESTARDSCSVKI